MDSAEAWKTVHEMVRHFSASMPRYIVALLIALFFFFLSSLVKSLVRRTTSVDWRRTACSPRREVHSLRWESSFHQRLRLSW
jgi:hypothetical protein